MASAWAERDRAKWRGVVRLDDGTRRSRSGFATKKVAKGWANEQLVDLGRGAFVDPKLGKVLYRDWLRVFREGEVALRPSTLARDAGVYENYILPTFGDMALLDVGQMTVQKWVAELARKGLKPSTVHKRYHVFTKTMDGAVDAGLIPVSPCRKIRLPEIVDEEMRFLTPTEVAQLAGVISPRWRAMIVLAAYSGLRISELAGLRRHRFDAMNSTIDVVEIALEVGGDIFTGPPKTKAGRRTVPVPREVSDLLVEHIARYTPDDRTALIFQGRRGGTIRASAWRSRHFNPAVAAANVAPLRIHDLRHTAVSIWIAAGVSVKEVAARAGHRSVATVLDRYGHLWPSSAGEFSERVGELYVAPNLTSADVVEINRARTV